MKNKIAKQGGQTHKKGQLNRKLDNILIDTTRDSFYLFFHWFTCQCINIFFNIKQGFSS